MLKASQTHSNDPQAQDRNGTAQQPSLPAANTPQAFNQALPTADFGSPARLCIADESAEGSDAPISPAFGAANDALQLRWTGGAGDAEGEAIDHGSHDAEPPDVLNTSFYDFNTSGLLNNSYLAAQDGEDLLSWSLSCRDGVEDDADDGLSFSLALDAEAGDAGSGTAHGTAGIAGFQAGQQGVLLRPLDIDSNGVLQNDVNASFFDFELGTPQGSLDLSTPSVQSPGVPIDLEQEHTLPGDHSHLLIPAYTHDLATTTRTLHPDALAQAQVRVITGIAFRGDPSSDLMDSEGGVPAFLMGCTQEHNAASQGGYHQ